MSPRSVRFYTQQVGYFLDAVQVDDVTTISADDVRGYLVTRQESGLAGNTVHAAGRALRAWFNCLVRDGWLKSSPMANVKLPKVDEKLLPPFEPGDIDKLMAAASAQRERAIVMCLLDSGARASELLAWNTEDVNLQTGTVQIQKSKNRKPRVAYLGNAARKELIKLLAEQGAEPGAPIWRARNGNRLTYSGLVQTLRRLGRAAGVEQCDAHRFRRTFALLSLRNGMDLVSLQRIMGHSDLEVLKRYLAQTTGDLQAQHERFGPGDRLRRK